MSPPDHAQGLWRRRDLLGRCLFPLGLQRSQPLRGQSPPGRNQGLLLRACLTGKSTFTRIKTINNNLLAAKSSKRGRGTFSPLSAEEESASRIVGRLSRERDTTAAGNHPLKAETLLQGAGAAQKQQPQPFREPSCTSSPCAGHQAPSSSAQLGPEQRPCLGGRLFLEQRAVLPKGLWTLSTAALLPPALGAQTWSLWSGHPARPSFPLECSSQRTVTAKGPAMGQAAAAAL